MSHDKFVQQADAATFDLWDTVLRRSCHPEALKRYSAGKLIELLGLQGVSVDEVYRTRLTIEAQLASQNDAGEFRLREVLLRWGGHYMPTCEACPSLARHIDALERLELEKELEVTYADPEIARLLAAARGRAYFLSDYYCSKEHLEALLDKVGLREWFAGGMVSCDEGESKRRGGLFRAAKQKLELSGRWVHVGDNEHSDIAQARAHGAQALLWRSAESAWLKRRAQALSAREQGSLEWGGPRLAASMGPWAYGQYLAPFVMGYCQYIEQVAQSSGARQILFLAREGLFFGKAYAQLYPRSAIALDVSRRALFAASIATDPRAGLERMWLQYRDQSPAAFCATINAPEEAFRRLFEAKGFAWDEPVLNVAANREFTALLDSSLFRGRLIAHLDGERHAVIGYITQQLGESPRQGASYIVSDVGWKGTIQDCLARIFPHSTWKGVYCGLALQNDPPRNAPKLGYVADAAVDAEWREFLKESLPFEMLFNAAQGSTLGYTLSDGRWSPRFEELGGESVVHKEFTRAVQGGCLSALPEVRAAVSGQAVSEAELREIARGLWLSVMREPPDCLLHAGFSLEHNEGFGVGAAVTFRRDFSWRELGKAAIRPEFRRRLHGWLDRMPWRRAVLKHRHTSWATRAALLAHHLRGRLR